MLNILGFPVHCYFSSSSYFLRKRTETGDTWRVLVIPGALSHHNRKKHYVLSAMTHCHTYQPLPSLHQNLHVNIKLQSKSVSNFLTITFNQLTEKSLDSRIKKNKKNMSDGRKKHNVELRIWSSDANLLLHYMLKSLRDKKKLVWLSRGITHNGMKKQHHTLNT